MKLEELTLSPDYKTNIWLTRCLPTEDWQEGHEEVKAILEKAVTSDMVISMILNSDTMKGTQIYAELSKMFTNHKERVMRGLDWCETYSDAGALKIGNSGFTVNIPNGYGDGFMHFTVVGKGCFNHNMLDFFTDVSGHEIDIYDYDCTGGNVVKTLDGWYGIYYGNGLVVFERWGDAQ